MARVVRILLNRSTASSSSDSVSPTHFYLYHYWYHLHNISQSFHSLPRIVCKNPPYVPAPQILSSNSLPASFVTALWSSNMATLCSIGSEGGELVETLRCAEDKKRKWSSSFSAKHLLLEHANVAGGEECVESIYSEGNLNRLQKQGKDRLLRREIDVGRATEDKLEGICNILRKDNDFGTRLEELRLKLSAELVQRVLANCHGFEDSAKEFFVWAALQAGFEHTSDTYDEMVKIAVKKKDFKYVAHLLAKMNAERLSSSRTFSFLMKEDGGPIIIDEMLRGFFRVKYPAPKYAYDALLFQLCQSNYVELALAAIQGMFRAGYRPFPQIYVALSSAWCERARVHEPQEILGKMRVYGYRPDGNTCNYILKALCAIGKVDDAYALLDSMRLAGCDPDSLSYHILIWGACEVGEVDGALQLLHRMIVHEGFTPRQKTYSAVIWALDRVRECIKGYHLVNFLNERECSLNFHNYQMVAEMCYENYEAIAAAEILIQMTEKGYIPYIELRQRVFQSLLRKGKEDIAWELRNRLMRLRS